MKIKWLQHSGSGGGLRYYTDNNNATNSIIKFEYPETYETKYSIWVEFIIHKSDNMAQESRVTLSYGSTSENLFKASNNTNYSGTRNYYKELSSFPTKVEIDVHAYWWTGWAQWEAKLYVKNYNTNQYVLLGTTGVKQGGCGTNTANYTVKDSQKPKASSIAGITGSNTLTLNPDGSVVSQSYSPGPVRDQYGYNIKGATATLTSDNAGGTSFTSNTLYGDENCNRSNDYPVTLTATYGSLTTTKTVTVKTFDYTVNFVNYDGTPIKSQSGIDYGGSADVPTNAQYTIQKPQDNTYIYTHDDTQWTGDYTNLSGVQTKTVTADYTPHYIDYTVTFNNDDGSLYASGTYHYGDTVSAPATNPSKQQDDENTYEFAGWSPAVVTTCAGSAVYTAQYTPTKRNYTVQFKDADGNVIPGFTQTLNWNAAITAPDTNPTKASTSTIDYTFNKWVNEADGSDYTGRCVGSINYIPSWTESTRHYTVTFQKEDGTVISSNSEMLYQSVPSQAGIVPELIDKAPDNDFHYTAAWDRDVTQPITGDTVFKIIYTPVAHTLDGEGTVTKEANCTQEGVMVNTCSVCHHDVTQVIPIDLTKHTCEIVEMQEPSDGSNGKVYFQCSGCSRYFAAVNDSVNHRFVPDPENTEGSVNLDSNIIEKSASVPAPTFNSFVDESIGSYDYSQRGASLKLAKETDTAGNPIQKMRFSGSVMVPGGLSETIDPANLTKYNAGNLDAITDDSVIDFGFIYTQHQYALADEQEPGSYLPDPTKLNQWSDAKRLYHMSVVSKNTGNFYTDPSYNNMWTGVTAHNLDDGGLDHTLTFNLLLNVKQKNWKSLYIARTYIVYKYHGEIYTVFDGCEDSVSDRAVWSVATQLYWNYQGTSLANYLTGYILNQAVEAAIPSSRIDWWKFPNEDGWSQEPTLEELGVQ